MFWKILIMINCCSSCFRTTTNIMIWRFITWWNYTFNFIICGQGCERLKRFLISQLKYNPQINTKNSNRKEKKIKQTTCSGFFVIVGKGGNFANSVNSGDFDKNDCVDLLAVQGFLLLAVVAVVVVSFFCMQYFVFLIFCQILLSLLVPPGPENFRTKLGHSLDVVSVPSPNLFGASTTNGFLTLPNSQFPNTQVCFY